MSLKLKAFLADNHKSRLQQAYKQNANIMVLNDVPCEMKFVSNDGWLEHESEQHQFLPVFHIKGNVFELHGNFPYNVSTLTFDEDTIKRLDKDILYFLTPSELSHLIETGKYFTKHFKLPKVLTNNAYDFPVRVNLTIIKPDDEAIYNSANFVLDKENLPVFYVEFAGTGVNRKNDKLLDYYGIDFDADYDIYAMTAESSGYTDPPLINYIAEPEIENEQNQTAKENESAYYLSPEEENSLIRAKEAEREKTEQHIEFADDYQFTDEDILIAAADKNIEKRVEERLEERRKALENNLNLQQDTSKSSDESYIDSQVTSDITNLLAAVTGQTITNQKPVLQPEVITNNVAFSELENKKTEPDTPEQMAEIKMDLNPLENETVKQEQKEKAENTAGLDNQENDLNKLADTQGADVSDTRLQAKVDEAKTREAAKSVAIDIQSDISKTSDMQSKPRKVSAKLQDIADEADRQEQMQNDDASYD